MMSKVHSVEHPVETEALDRSGWFMPTPQVLQKPTPHTRVQQIGPESIYTMSLNGTQQHPLVYTSFVAASEQLSHCHRDKESLQFGLLNLQSLRYIYCQVFYWKHLPTPPIKQCHSVKLSMLMKMFFIYIIQYGSHWPWPLIPRTWGLWEF